MIHKIKMIYERKESRIKLKPTTLEFEFSEYEHEDAKYIAKTLQQKCKGKYEVKLVGHAINSCRYRHKGDVVMIYKIKIKYSRMESRTKLRTTVLEFEFPEDELEDAKSIARTLEQKCKGKYEVKLEGHSSVDINAGVINE